MLNQVTQAAGSRPEVTQVSLVSQCGPPVLPSTPVSPLSRKASSRSTGPHPLPLQQGQRMDQPFQLPLEIQGMGATGSQPLAPKEAQHHSEHPEGIPPTTTAWHGHRQEMLNIHTAASPPACAHANKCGLKHGTVVLPLAHELERVAVSSRGSEPHAMCYSRGGMP